jgi:hypothetical protein
MIYNNTYGSQPNYYSASTLQGCSKFRPLKWTNNPVHKKALLLCLSIILFQYVFGQSDSVKVADTVKLDKGETVLNPVISAQSNKAVQQIVLSIELGGPAPQGKEYTVVPVLINQPRRSKVDPVLLTETIKINKEEWPGAGKTKSVNKTVVIQTTSIKDLTADELFYLKLDKSEAPKEILVDDCADCNHQIRVTLSGMYNANKPFWVEIGSNFDLVDGMEPNNFFTGVFFYKRDIRPIFYRKSNINERRKDQWRKKYSGKNDNERASSLLKRRYRTIDTSRPNTLGAFAGVFESKTITSITEERFTLREYYDSTSVLPRLKDSMLVYKAIGTKTRKTTVRNVSLFFSPQVRLTNKPSNADGLHWFASLWTELQWQRIREEAEFKQLKVMDTDTLPLNDVLDNQRYNAKLQSKETDVRSHYIGFGFPVFFKETLDNDVAHLFVNPVIGYTNQPSSQYLKDKEDYDLAVIKDPSLLPPKRKWYPFYIVQFRLNEENYGIAFTGEVRGLLWNNSQPYVSLSLTKKFDLTRFIEFNK